MKNNLFKVGIGLIVMIAFFSWCSNKVTPKPNEETILNTPYSITSAMSLVVTDSDILQKYGEPDVVSGKFNILLNLTVDA